MGPGGGTGAEVGENEGTGDELGAAEMVGLGVGFTEVVGFAEGFPVGSGSSVGSAVVGSALGSGVTVGTAVKVPPPQPQHISSAMKSSSSHLPGPGQAHWLSRYLWHECGRDELDDFCSVGLLASSF